MTPEQLEHLTVFMSLAGSHAYGTNTPESDIDLRGIALEPRSAILGTQPFEQYESKPTKPTPVFLTRLVEAAELPIVEDEPLDYAIFALRKFVTLAARTNPNIIEQLFTSERCILFRDPILDPLFEIRDAFVSKAARYSFSGYAISQLRRIRRHKRWLDNPIEKQPQREDYGLPEKHGIPKHQLNAAEALIRKKLDDWTLDALDRLDHVDALAINQRQSRILKAVFAAGYEVGSGGNKIEQVDALESDDVMYRAAVTELGFDSNFMAYLEQEKRYKRDLRDWQSYQTWKKERNPVRAKLEKESGFDRKHASHLVRLLRMGVEILETGKINVDRTQIDAEELSAIRHRGIWTYEQLVEWAEAQDKKLDELYKTSTLPRSPRWKKINPVLESIMEKSLSRSR